MHEFRTAKRALPIIAGLILPLSAVPGAAAPGDQEVVPPTEAGDAAKVVATIGAVIAKVHADSGKPALRDAHAKGHGCVKARFNLRAELLAKLPDELRQGIFAAPHVFDAWIRFSSSSGSLQPDYIGDARGMAIKLLDVPGPKLLADEADARTQDFVMITRPSFFIRDVADYPPFVTAVLAGRQDVFFATHPQEKAIFDGFNGTPVDVVFKQHFFSASPYRLGDVYTKFAVRPADCRSRATLAAAADPVAKGDASYLRRTMATWLGEKDACFTFALQPQTDAARQNIEDARIVWDEASAPMVDVADITIPQQVFDTPAQQAFCENLSFTPWHSQAVLRPVGGINRLRKSIYAAISTLRHSLNGTSRVEPGP